MSDLKITEYATGGAAQSTDQLVIARAGANYNLQLADITALPPSTQVTMTIASTTFKAAFSTPVVLVSGSTGVWIIPYIFNFKKAAGTAYVLNGNTNLAFRWTNGSVIANNGMAGLFDTTSTTYFVARYTSNLANSTILNPTIIGAGLDLKLDTADMVTGTGDVTVTISYERYTVIP